MDELDEFLDAVGTEHTTRRNCQTCSSKKPHRNGKTGNYMCVVRDSGRRCHDNDKWSPLADNWALVKKKLFQGPNNG